MPSIEIHLITFNEEIMLPFTLDHYKKMFSNVSFVIHDNESTDRTVEIARSYGCRVETFQTNHKMSDLRHAEIKSQAAMNAKTDWVLVLDCDECCLINDSDLQNAQFNIVKFKGYEIFDQVDSPYDTELMGLESVGYSKPVLIKTGIFTNITFAVGAHQVNVSPTLRANWSIEQYKLLHFKHWKFDYSLGRSHFLATRQSEENLRNRHSFHFALPDDIHSDYFFNGYNNRKKIEDPRLSPSK